ncbi:hypothetical protein SynRS9909_01348 [Synechococcus sp. RS9909]|nr:hypothetical protein RS9917_13230 [Synechococcus sp. RS9917]QNI79335.1 hypothetical protein SynRS9909_01348 [Synechococcus sp. RS9909]
MASAPVGSHRSIAPHPRAFADLPVFAALFTTWLELHLGVALTFAISDVELEDGFARRVVFVQAIVSFLFYSTIFSMVTNLMVS